MREYDNIPDERKKAIQDAFAEWVETGSAPGQPYVEIGDEEYTPREMLDEIQNESTVGRIQLQTIDTLAEHQPDSSVRDIIRQL